MNLQRHPRDLILCYHRLHESNRDQKIARSSVSVESFCEQIAWLRSVGDIVDLSRMLNERIGRTGSRRIAITFDDGYADNINCGLGLFERLKVPVTWFVSSGFVRDRRKRPWWNVLEDLADGEALAVWKEIKNMDGMGSVLLEDRGSIRERIAKVFKRSNLKKRETLEEILMSTYEKERGEIVDNEFATEEMIRQAAATDWVTLGAHTTWHVSASAMSKNELEDDVKQNCRDLEGWSGRHINLFAYPYGGLPDFTEESSTVIEELGFKAAVTTRPGYISYPYNPYALNRITVHRKWSPAKFKAAVLYTRAFYNSFAIKSRIDRAIGR